MSNKIWSCKEKILLHLFFATQNQNNLLKRRMPKNTTMLDALPNSFDEQQVFIAQRS
jgi:hypothetical protein